MLDEWLVYFNTYMNENKPKEEEPIIPSEEHSDHNLHEKDKPKYRKKQIKDIFKMTPQEIKKYSKKKKR